MHTIVAFLIVLLLMPVTGFAQSCYAVGDQELAELRAENELLRDAKPIRACLYGNTRSTPPQVRTTYEFLLPAADTFQSVSVTQRIVCERSAQPSRCTATNVA